MRRIMNREVEKGKEGRGRRGGVRKEELRRVREVNNSTLRCGSAFFALKWMCIGQEIFPVPRRLSTRFVSGAVAPLLRITGRRRVLWKMQVLLSVLQPE